MLGKYEKKGLSKYCSYLLRHHPEDLNLQMSVEGWVSVDELVSKLNRFRNFSVNEQDILEMVRVNDKQRFAIKEEDSKLLIRANQGHSIRWIQMDYKPVNPPHILYHGTGEKYVQSILKKGIMHKGRQYVHLSSTIEMAKLVGQRHGKVRIFVVDCDKMVADGCIFYCSENGVWLTDYVDSKYIKLM